MFYTDKKLEMRISEIRGMRYRQKFSLETFYCKEDTLGVVNPPVPVDGEITEELKMGHHWSGRDKFLWLQKKVEIPASFAGKKVVGLFDFGSSGGFDGFEALFYVNGVPYQGVDVHHMEVVFKEEHTQGELDLAFRLWSGLEGGGAPTPRENRIVGADIAWLDEKVERFYYLGQTILETTKRMDELNETKYRLTRALDDACLVIDWSYPGSEEFYASVYQALEVLTLALDKIEKTSDITIQCVGHTHIDVAWLWRLKHTKEKAARSFATVLRLMEQYPEYLFLQTQPQIYEYVKEEFPEMYEQIKERVKEGRWEVDGAMWVEADCNLTSGESLTRQILIGSKFMKEEFGKESKYLWLPDVFGYSWALPQILKKSGIDTFMTTKISWNQYNRMPHDTFWWKGLDGSEVLTHFITTPEPWNAPGSWFGSYNGKMSPLTVRGIWEQYSEKEMNNELLLAYGFGDGGGGVNREMLERRRVMDEMPGLPHVKTSSAKEYFEGLHERVEHTNSFVHTWDGELYFEYHRGTYTSQAYNKKANRKIEQLYRQTEWFTVMQAIAEESLEVAQQEKLTQGWKKILTNQFHDIIPGSSIREVYEDSKIDYDYAEALAREVQKDFLDSANTEKAGCYTVLNSFGNDRSDVVILEEEKEGSFVDLNGTVLESQVGEGKTYVWVEQVPSMGATNIFFTDNKKAEETAAFSIEGRSMETPFYLVSFNEEGQISRLYDKEAKREILAAGERGNVFQIFEDKPMGHEAWDIDIYYLEKMKEIHENCRFEVTECGKLMMKIKASWKYQKSTIEQEIIFYSKTKKIDFVTKVDYQEQRQLLKVAFPVNIRANYATYDIQYGNVKRPNHWNTSWDVARFESVAHRWVDLSERNYGISILNDCKYGHDVKDNVMRLSLIKAAINPDHLQDQGEHYFTYSLFPHAGDFVEGNVVEEAFFVNEPLQAFSGRLDLGMESFLTSNSKSIEIDAIKKSESGEEIVIRFHEFTGSTEQVELKLGFEYQSWCEADLMERAISEYTKEAISLTTSPYEIKTILVKLA